MRKQFAVSASVALIASLALPALAVDRRPERAPGAARSETARQRNDDRKDTRAEMKPEAGQRKFENGNTARPEMKTERKNEKGRTPEARTGETAQAKREALKTAEQAYEQARKAAREKRDAAIKAAQDQFKADETAARATFEAARKAPTMTDTQPANQPTSQPE